MRPKSEPEELFYTDTTNGNNTLVFLHYFGGSSQTWKYVIKFLQKDYRCIAVDLSGFGNSNKSDNTLTVYDHANDVLHLLHLLNLESFTLIGHSMGGKIAMAVASQQPPGLQQLILVASSPPSPEPMTNEERETLRNAFVNKELLEKNIAGITEKLLPTSIIEELVNTNLLASYHAWNAWLNVGSKEDITSNVAEVSIPIHIVAAEKDKNLSPEILQKTIADKLSNTTMHVIKNCGHLIPVEKPKKLADMIRSLT